MKYIAVIGNGESRKPFDLYSLQWLGHSIGTNAVHRDYHPDELVCVDRRMVQEAVNTGYENPVYTREDWYKQFAFWRNVRRLPDLPYKGRKRPDDTFHWNSGPHALNLACTYNPEIIFVLGFDLYGTGKDNKFFNNIYKNSDNYNGAEQPLTDPSYWEYQIPKLFELFPKTKFMWIQPDSWEPPEEWDSYENFFIDNYDNFKVFIDKQK